jgi:hypothetical protein
MTVDPLDLALARAQRLGHDWVGPQRFLHPLLDLDEDNVATRALRDCGVVGEAIEASLRRQDQASERANGTASLGGPEFHLPEAVA